MKAIVSQPELAAVVGRIQSIISQKPAIPILANLLIEACDGALWLSASDLTVSVRVSVQAKVLEEGAITLPARRFFQLLRELTMPQITIETNGSEIASIEAGPSHFKIHGMRKSEFPQLPDLTGGLKLDVESSLLKSLLSRTAFAAAAREEDRQMLSGVSIQSQGGVATFIGTDGKRLARLKADVDLSKEAPGSYVIPIKAVEEIVKMLDGKEPSVHLTLMQDKIGVESGRVLLVSKLLSGQYPDVSRVIPKRTPQSISLHREELIALLRQVALFTSESSSSVRFSFSPGSLQLSAMSGEIGEGKVSMPVHYNGPKIDIAFNPGFFLDILRHSEDETVNFDITDPYNPGLITDSTSAEFVIMPMRLEL